MDILNQVSELNLPLGKYAIFGSGPMAIHGIRDSQDIDLIVISSLYEDLLFSGWQEEGNGGNRHLVKGNIEIFDKWDFENYYPNPEQLINEAEIINGVAVIQLSEVIKWKNAFGRDKDLADVKLIQNYLLTKK